MQPKTREEWCAVHEAGHACHAFLLGHVPNGLWVQHDDHRNTALQGRVEVAPFGPELGEELLCSGFEAEILLGRPEEHALLATDVLLLLNTIANRMAGKVFVLAGGSHEAIVQELTRIRSQVANDLEPYKNQISDLAAEILLLKPVSTALISVGISPFPIFHVPHPEVRIMYSEQVDQTLRRLLGQPGHLAP